LTELLGQKAVSAINTYAEAKQRFLLSLHFNAPHWPWEAPGDEAESQRIKELAHYDGGTQKTYQRMIQEMDLQIGKVLHALDENVLTENTLVIFTSDNGGERFADTWPFTGRKSELLEEDCAFPRYSRGLLAFLRGARRSKWRSVWIGCRHCLPQPAARPIRRSPRMG
jgi:arylsulfatase A-like enzyme